MTVYDLHGIFRRLPLMTGLKGIEEQQKEIFGNKF